MSFGSKLKALRLDHNMTQLELAKKINLSKANVSKYEADLVEPNLDTLAMISGLFDVSINYLLGLPDKDTHLQQGISKPAQAILDFSSDLSEDELKKVKEYIDFLKTKRN
ncbi:MAG: helix-turn-helix transcriptional regulator [Clostridia bacterium]|nr:helix-turn-helix transcriptional regulator [Clostridia bacterium]